MDQEIVINALEKHLDLLQSIFNWIIVLSVVTAWAGIQRKDEVEAFGLKVNRKHAYYLVCALYLVGNVINLTIFLRISDLLRLLENDQSYVKGLSTIATHPWILNPFSYFGESVLARVHGYGGLGLLIVVWWLSSASLFSLREDKRKTSAITLPVIFSIVGLASLGAVFNIYNDVMMRVKVINIEGFNSLTSAYTQQMWTSLLGLCVGILIFFAANRLQKRHGPNKGVSH